MDSWVICGAEADEVRCVDALEYKASVPNGGGRGGRAVKAHAWKACWGQPLRGSNPRLSALFIQINPNFNSS